jgi:hypothetical protein
MPLRPRDSPQGTEGQGLRVHRSRPSHVRFISPLLTSAILHTDAALSPCSYSIADLAFHGWLRIIQMAKMSLDDYPTLKAYAAKLEALPYVKAGSDKLGEAIANHKSKQ